MGIFNVVYIYLVFPMNGLTAQVVSSSEPDVLSRIIIKSSERPVVHTQATSVD